MDLCDDISTLSADELQDSKPMQQHTAYGDKKVGALNSTKRSKSINKIEMRPVQ
jgi:hypothetical protein